MSVREKRQREIRSKFESGDTAFFMEELRAARDLFTEHHSDIVSIPGFERDFRLLNDRGNTEERLAYQIEIMKIAEEWERFYRELSKRRKSPCAEICKKLADVYRDILRSVRQAHSNAKRAFKNVFKVRYEPQK